MKNLRFSFLPSWAKGQHDSVEISMSQVETGYEFKCDESESECVHPMAFGDVSKFLLEVGADPKANPFEVVQELIDAGKDRQVHAAIHATLKPSFVWP